MSSSGKQAATHAGLPDVSSDQHHTKSHGHTGADGSGTVAHAATTGKTADDHHNQAHADAQHTDGPNAKTTDPLGLAVAWSVDPRLASVTTGGTANRCYATRNTFGQATGATTLAFMVSTSAGNVSVAVYNNNNSAGRAASPGTTRRITTGAFACPAAGYSASTISSTTVLFGDWMALTTDSVTAVFYCGPILGFPATGTVGLNSFQDSAHPAPSSGASITGTISKILLVGAY
jgi:hypothetical protein